MFAVYWTEIICVSGFINIKCQSFMDMSCLKIDYCLKEHIEQVYESIDEK